MLSRLLDTLHMDVHFLGYPQTQLNYATESGQRAESYQYNESAISSKVWKESANSYKASNSNSIK
jgi:hypothetical protein